MSHGMPPLPPPFREQLLTTDADAVDPLTADAIRVFCEGEPEIQAAYVCLVKRTREGEEPERALRLSVTLNEPAGGFEGSHPHHLPLIERFVQAHPDVVRRFGFGVLTGNGVPAFERYGLTIYHR